MIEIVFVACLIGAPDQCSERHMPPFIDISVMQCVMGAQTHLAQWAERNPEYRIVRWQCGKVLHSQAL